jgi:hypothetical protein
MRSPPYTPRARRRARAQISWVIAKSLRRTDHRAATAANTAAHRKARRCTRSADRPACPVPARNSPASAGEDRTEAPSADQARCSRCLATITPSSPIRYCASSATKPRSTAPTGSPSACYTPQNMPPHASWNSSCRRRARVENQPSDLTRRDQKPNNGGTRQGSPMIGSTLHHAGIAEPGGQHDPARSRRARSADRLPGLDGAGRGRLPPKARARPDRTVEVAAASPRSPAAVPRPNLLVVRQRRLLWALAPAAATDRPRLQALLGWGCVVLATLMPPTGGDFLHRGYELTNAIAAAALLLLAWAGIGRFHRLRRAPGRRRTGAAPAR